MSYEDDATKDEDDTLNKAPMGPRLRRGLERHFLVADWRRARARLVQADDALSHPVPVGVHDDVRAVRRQLARSGIPLPLARELAAWIGAAASATADDGPMEAWTLEELVSEWRACYESPEKLAGHLLLVHGSRSVRGMGMRGLARMHARLHGARIGPGRGLGVADDEPQAGALGERVLPRALLQALERHFLVAGFRLLHARMEAAREAYDGQHASRTSAEVIAQRLPRAVGDARLGRALAEWFDARPVPDPLKVALVTDLLDHWLWLAIDRERLAGHLALVHRAPPVRGETHERMVRRHVALHRA